MATAYATSDELNEFLSTAVVVDEDEVSRLLLRASAHIDPLVRAGFEVGDDGLAADTDIAAVLRDATCAQVEQWLEVGEENAVDGLAGTQVSVTGYSGPRAPKYAPRAVDAIVGAGLHQPIQYVGWLRGAA